MIPYRFRFTIRTRKYDKCPLSILILFLPEQVVQTVRRPGKYSINNVLLVSIVFSFGTPEVFQSLNIILVLPLGWLAGWLHVNLCQNIDQFVRFLHV